MKDKTRKLCFHFFSFVHREALSIAFFYSLHIFFISIRGMLIVVRRGR